ncbi:hypothetical protein B0H19DRAFT_120070 [Mycena capillaripes]|nr:hypothetical protein B0H19DRAFT_120070 [Mycena capillaripes]
MTRAEFFAMDLPYSNSDPGILWADLGCASVFRNSPKLRNVYIHAFCGGIDPHVLCLPWASLTNIDLESTDIGVADTREILQLVVNALDLRLCTGARQGAVMPPMQAVRLPIKRLMWRGLYVDDTSILAPLILPNLIVLDLRDASDESLRLLRERASFKLEELKLVFTQLAFPAISAFLRDTHTLTTLELRLSIALTDEFMKLLTYDVRMPVLPALKSLTLFERKKYFDERTMLRMVESRWLGASPCAPLLRQVEISTKPLPGLPGSVFDSRAIVPLGLAVVPISPASIRRGILDRIAEMNEEGLSFKYEIIE